MLLQISFLCSEKENTDTFSLFAVSKKDKNYEATRLHFENLVKRYGNPIIILNLIKVSFIILPCNPVEILLLYALVILFKNQTVPSLYFSYIIL